MSLSLLGGRSYNSFSCLSCQSFPMNFSMKIYRAFKSIPTSSTTQTVHIHHHYHILNSLSYLNPLKLPGTRPVQSTRDPTPHSFPSHHSLPSPVMNPSHVLPSNTTSSHPNPDLLILTKPNATIPTTPSRAAIPTSSIPQRQRAGLIPSSPQLPGKKQPLASNMIRRRALVSSNPAEARPSGLYLCSGPFGGGIC